MQGAACRVLRLACECGRASVNGACSFSRLRQDRLANDLPDLGNIGVGHVTTVHRRLRRLRAHSLDIWGPSFNSLGNIGANLAGRELAGTIGQIGRASWRLDAGSHRERAPR